MVEQERIPQTLLLAGPEGVGSHPRPASGRRVIGDAQKTEQDDLSLPHNVPGKERGGPRRRAEDLTVRLPTDYVTFAPDGPLRQISMPQTRAQRPGAVSSSRGSRRVFLIDHLDRANEQAANSLLKTLEEPPDHLILVLTAENAQDLLPTIRSRAVQLHLGPLSPAEMASFVGPRGLDQPERRIRLVAGSPGRAVSLDLEDYDRRKTAMFALLQAARVLRRAPGWSMPRQWPRREARIVFVGFIRLLEDLMVAAVSGDVRNLELAGELKPIASVSFNGFAQPSAKWTNWSGCSGGIYRRA
jgi:DNA polymerase-3 subunit delta'